MVSPAISSSKYSVSATGFLPRVFDPLPVSLGETPISIPLSVLSGWISEFGEELGGVSGFGGRVPAVCIGITIDGFGSTGGRDLSI